MPIDAAFLQSAQRLFNPYSPYSGTEHVGLLLYALARMTRPRTVVEFGSGYSTLLLLRALADNLSDIREERSLLARKTEHTRILETVNATALETNGIATLPDLQRATAYAWFASNDKSCGVDPVFYLSDYRPHLYSFERLSAAHAYSKKVRAAVQATGHESLFTHLCDQDCDARSLPPDARPVDWAWNDHAGYRQFFAEFWEHLNPAGGLLILHNIPGSAEGVQDIEWMKEQRAAHADLEVLVLEEPHKLDQKGCAILRRTSTYEPRPLAGGAPGLLGNLSRFMARTRD
jgi:hypothetical protein